MIPPQPRPTLFPYTTLFRSEQDRDLRRFLFEDASPSEHSDGLAHALRAVAARFEDGAQRMGEPVGRSEEHTSELQSRPHLVCRLLLEKKKKEKNTLELRSVN